MLLISPLVNHPKRMQDASKKRNPGDNNVGRNIGIIPAGKGGIKAANVEFDHQFVNK